MHSIFDIACNFTSDRFDDDLEVVIKRAKRNNITKFGLICSRVDDLTRLLQIYNDYSDSMYFTIGVHPHHANEINKNNINEITDLIAKYSPSAVGETGLDFSEIFQHTKNKFMLLKNKLR